MTDTSSNLRPGEALGALYLRSACDLPVQDGEMIRLNAVYRWDGQAWGLHPPEPCADSAGSGGVALESSRLRARAGGQPAFEALEQLARDEQAVVEVVGTFWSSPARVEARSLRAQVYRAGGDGM